jgi:hypothetical protein
MSINKMFKPYIWETNKLPGTIGFAILINWQSGSWYFKLLILAWEINYRPNTITSNAATDPKTVK